jgi:hypothetical protein
MTFFNRLNLGLAEDPTPGPVQTNEWKVIKDSETASEFTLPHRNLPSFQSLSDITLYRRIFQRFCCSKTKTSG